MNKSKLSLIPINNVNKSLVNNYLEADINFFISASTSSINTKDDTLVISVYSKHLVVENLTLLYRVFLDKITKNYISQSLTEDKITWKLASMRNLINYSWEKTSIILDNKSNIAILKYFKVKEKPFNRITEFQESVMRERLAKKHKSIIDRIDDKMKLVPSLPNNFKKWVDTTGLYQSRYIYYKYVAGNKPISGFCTHCKADVLVKKPRHNKGGICPSC